MSGLQHRLRRHAFGNLVNGRDLQLLFAKLPTRLSLLARRMFLSGRQRTIETYSRPVRNDQWWSVHAVQRRWNQLVTGDPDCDHYTWLASRFLMKPGLRGLSVGCGEGAREMAWARTGRFAKLLAVDLTPNAIDVARRAAAAAGLNGVLDFRVGDLADLDVVGREPFDVIIGEHSVHHLTPLRGVLAGLRERLVPGGLFLMNEFVGPTRFQWSDRQLEVINGLLRVIPARLRRTLDGKVKTREYRPSLLYMLLNDPSEAVESSRILPLMDELFERVEVRPYGGNVLHLLLSKIGHNFADDDDEAQGWLKLLFEVEDKTLATEMMASDFVVAVYRRR